MAEEKDNRPGERDNGASLRERGRQWFITLGTALALLATVIGFLSDSVGVLEFFQGKLAPNAEPSPTVIVRGGATDDGMVTPTPAATPTVVETPTATPVPVVAAENEQLLVIGQFTNFTVDANYNVAGRIHEALSKQVAAARLEDTRVAVWPTAIEDNNSANEVMALSKAVMVIWGEYDSGRVRIRFTVAGGGAEMDWERLLGAPTELSTTINLDVPRETQALALMALGRLYRNAGDITRARAAFAQALAQQPSDQDTVATLTFYLAILDATATPPALDRAIEGYTAVIALRPNWFNARYNRGLAYLTRYWMSAQVENLDAAIDDFTWTIEAQERYTEAYINRAIAYYARNGEGDMDASVTDLDAAIRFNRSSYRAYYNRGLAYIRLDQSERWVADLEKALELEPSFWVSHHALCWGYALDGNVEAGLPHCDEAVSHDPSGSTRDGRGLLLAQMNRLDEAAEDLAAYLAWLDTQPDVWSTLNNRAVYEEILEGLRSGEVLITPELLDRLR